ncbi:MAG TPA: TetR/AcrR family transcriptional regulator [Thermodesulfobacteriota bacterium]|jgi:AcrR family transcriptional regulator|nr:TetR/AcrR family transcriptional regulator [Thermodesulfobacteriota bacterium]
MQNKKLPRREREKLRQRQEMLASAVELFSEKGYHNVSMHEIAEKAEFAIGTLYKFFKNKEDLYKALILGQADKFHDALTKAIEDPDDEIEKLRNYVKTKGSVFRANVSVIRLYFAETGGASFNVMAGLDCEIRERYGQFLQTLASIFASGIKRKRFKKIADPYHLAVAIDSLTNAFLFLWLEAPDRHPYPENPDTILDILFKGLVVP